MPATNHLLDDIQPSAIRAFDIAISDIPDIIKLTIGEPDFSVPENIKAAAVASIMADDSHYAASAGKPAARAAVAAFLADRYQLSYTAEQVIMTVGATEALHTTLTALLNTGDELLVPTPTFPLYFSIATVAGAKVVSLSTATTGFKLTPAALTAALERPGARIKALLLNYPSNPTGVTYTRSEIADLAAVLAGRDITIISDEIYSELTYQGRHTSLAEFLPAQTVVISGLSKSHAMTGYRVGFLAAPTAIYAKLAMVHQFTITTSPNMTMAAAIEALTAPASQEATQQMVTAYRERRNLVVAGLREAGFTVPDPEGAFYVFAQLPVVCGTDDVAFAHQLAEQAQVGCVPGTCFGAGGEGYIRLSYAASYDVLVDAIKRIQYFVNQSQ